jgi:hypothetical protein
MLFCTYGVIPSRDLPPVIRPLRALQYAPLKINMAPIGVYIVQLNRKAFSEKLVLLEIQLSNECEVKSRRRSNLYKCIYPAGFSSVVPLHKSQFCTTLYL